MISVQPIAVLVGHHFFVRCREQSSPYLWKLYSGWRSHPFWGRTMALDITLNVRRLFCNKKVNYVLGMRDDLVIFAVGPVYEDMLSRVEWRRALNSLVEVALLTEPAQLPILRPCAFVGRTIEVEIDCRSIAVVDRSCHLELGWQCLQWSGLVGEKQ